MREFNYQRREIQDVLDAGSATGEDWYRLQASGAHTSKHLNVTRQQLEAIRELFASPAPPVQQILVTLGDGRQVALMHGAVQVRSSMGGTWSLPIEESDKPHQPGSFFVGEW